MINKKIEILHKIGLVTFPLLQQGWQYSWCNKKDIINYALLSLNNEKYINNKLVILLAGADYEDDDTVQDYLNTLIKNEQLIDRDIIDKWKIAFLIEIKEMKCSDKEKIDRLQTVYSTFDYSKDMSGLSIYSDDHICPIKAMEEIIATKLNYLGIKK